jgi:flagellar FliJ protein
LDRKFKLQKILEYRERIFEIEKQKLSTMMNRLKDLKYKRELLANEIAAKKKELDAFLMEKNFEFVNMGNKYLGRLFNNLHVLDKEIKKVKDDIEKQKEAIVTAMNDVKIMENLKEKHNANYMAYLKKEEMKLLDELVITRGKYEH